MSSPDIRICFVGESFVNGTGDSDYLGWTGRVCQTLARRGLTVTHYNLGIRRETSTELALRWQAECDRRLPVGGDNRLVFAFGTNDTTLEADQPRVSISQSLANLRQILGQAQTRYPVLMIGPAAILDTAQTQRIQALSQHYAQVCGDLGVPYLEVAQPLAHSSIWMAEVAAGDGAHPDAAGYAEYARLVESWAAWQSWFASAGEQKDCRKAPFDD